MGALAAVDWSGARTALGEVVPRVTDLLRSGPDPAAPALGQWTLADLAAHLSHAWALMPRLVRGEATSPLVDMWDLTGTTVSIVEDDPERDLGVLAGRIEASAAEFLTSIEATDPDVACTWLVDGVRLPLRCLVCHLLNESVVHGYDMARAAGRPWPIERTHAALVLMGFIFPLLGALDPRTMVDQDRAAGLSATYDVRLRGGGRAYFVFDDGALAVESPSERRVDCRLSADPTALLLVAWARTSQWSAIARGQLLAWGRRPWLGVQLRGFMKNT